MGLSGPTGPAECAEDARSLLLLTVAVSPNGLATSSLYGEATSPSGSGSRLASAYCESSGSPGPRVPSSTAPHGGGRPLSGPSGCPCGVRGQRELISAWSSGRLLGCE